MAHLTKADIEQKLLSGASLKWRDANGKGFELVLNDPKERRLFAFLLSSTVRAPTGLSEDFIIGLTSAFSGTDDPATSIAAAPQATIKGPWRLQSIETEGFGGLNIWGGPVFQISLDGESLLIEGPNGSGKSALIGAVIWALSGERPRDHSDSRATEPKPVFGMDEKPVGDWPPIACYPPTAGDLKSSPQVRSLLTFTNARGDIAKVERTLDDGGITTSIDPDFDIPSILLEAGVLMPARLASLRLDEGRSRLTDAVQKLTGLDDFIAIGALADGLCNKAREYRAYKRKDHSTAKVDFDQSIGEARGVVASVDVKVPDFAPLDTDDKQGEMATLGKMLSDRAAELTQVVSDDLADGLDLTIPTVQHNIISAIGAAKAELETGLIGLSAWKTLELISQTLDDEVTQRVTTAIASARSRGEEAVRLLEKSSQDTKFQLKAVASRWHHQHGTGPIENCPLCEHDLKSDPSLSQELEALRSAGDAATRTFDDNLNGILSELDAFLPTPIKSFCSEALTLEPRAKLVDELRATFVTKDRYAKFLTKFGVLVETALSDAPKAELDSVQAAADATTLKNLNEKIAIIERLLDLSEWFVVNGSQWSGWWQNLAALDELSEDSDRTQSESESSEESPPERLATHLDRLSDALTKAEPYRKAAEAMRKAWKAGLIAAEIEKELKRREAIAESLFPLKSLGSFAEAVARETIEGLSGRIAKHLKNTLLTQQLQFRSTRLSRKEGLVVRGGFADDLNIDATLVANTSWLRAVLWAFLFALREEAIEQIGSDQFPLFAFDDPQSTFDGAHRHGWAQYVASLQNGPSKAQVFLTTYDEMFLDLIKVSGVTGRQAMIAAAGPELKHVGIFEGDSLDRKWIETKAASTDAAGCDYIAKVRVYVEGLLRLMLRGEGAAIPSVVGGFVVGESRDKLDYLNKKGIGPWDRPEFKKLVNVLQKDLTSIKHMEISHHAGGASLGMTEAVDVEAHWRTKLGPALDKAFQFAREYHHLHGGLTALHAPRPTAVLPEGYQAKVRSIPLRVLGRAAALSDGQVADGCLDMDDFATSDHKNIVLAQHFAFRLTAPTLEPVARSGDILLIKELGEPTPRSLVVALSEERILARRFEIADNHSDVAVLTAQSINPRQIASPVIAHKATFKLHKIIGVLFDDSGWSTPAPQGMEISECGGEAVLNHLAAGAFGLIEVAGQSAEPLVLHGQYLIIKEEVSAAQALKTLVGSPIIAADTNGNRYFKRLQFPEDNQVVLESLESGGNYSPVVLSSPGKGKNCLEHVWPVAGVLFELPN